VNAQAAEGAANRLTGDFAKNILRAMDGHPLTTEDGKVHPGGNPGRYTERQFQAQVESLLKMLGWRYYHTWKSFNSARGFPDIFAVRPPRAVAMELKTARGKVTPEQQAWVKAMAECGVEAGIWRPDEWDELVELVR
jgi:VRR-NUC domain